jgi:tetraacyldisaccharide 4'-kinase
MRDPAFWWSRRGFAAWLLYPIAWIYAAIADRRMQRSGLQLRIPVICVGNFTLGGAGKTPTALALAAMLMETGENPFFLTRGHGGRLAGPLRIDPKIHNSDDIGDEPLLLARAAPTIVARNRAAGGRLAEQLGASIIVMDDGLQNPSLAKTLSLAVVDARRGIGNGLVCPAGPLRASLPAQLERVDAVIFVGDGRKIPSAISNMAMTGKRPLLRARLEPEAASLKALDRRKVLAFAGIGDPEKFFMMLAGAGVEATIEQSFADHHRYTKADVEALLASCDEKNLVPVTTEKDLVRLQGGDPVLAALAARSRAIPVTLVFEDQKAVKGLLKDAAAKRRSA